MSTRAWLPALLSLSACMTSAPEPEPVATVDPTMNATRPPEAWSGSTLYARDGTTVVQDQADGAPKQASRAEEVSGPLPGRDLRSNESSRMYILELYQNVIEERDGLALEVSALQAELEAARNALIQADGEIAHLQATVGSLQEQGQDMLAENLELAERLTTAQIRRLQAEKLLLEVRLDEERTRLAQAQAEVSRP